MAFRVVGGSEAPQKNTSALSALSAFSAFSQNVSDNATPNDRFRTSTSLSTDRSPVV